MTYHRLAPKSMTYHRLAPKSMTYHRLAPKSMTYHRLAPKSMTYPDDKVIDLYRLIRLVKSMCWVHHHVVT
ncbi:hypothetical protein PCANC_26604 [Puccinia coronata f. sp. avenae]|uniref:Uncharacterized protein n=1 Tax=Puccinia coronata f. sp. avenae TaxID=200324 RepID=A0A2N5RWY0_9BASI|nr:hypothetical protein PCANC_26604 [Puccinia coronata f. sp. avenae]